MTRDEHITIYSEHKDKAIALLRKSNLALEQGQYKDSRKLFDEYLAESKIANKHWGIAQAMWTRKHGRI